MLKTRLSWLGWCFLNLACSVAVVGTDSAMFLCNAVCFSSKLHLFMSVLLNI